MRPLLLFGALTLFLTSCSQTGPSVKVSIAPDGDAFTLSLDEKEVLLVSTKSLKSATERFTPDGSLRVRKYVFVSQDGKEVEVDVDRFEGRMHRHGTGRHVLESNGQRFIANAEYTFDDKWFKNIKVRLSAADDKGPSTERFVEATRP